MRIVEASDAQRVSKKPWFLEDRWRRVSAVTIS